MAACLHCPDGGRSASGVVGQAGAGQGGDLRGGT